MSERLRFHLARNVIKPHEYRAGMAWYGDWVECGRSLQMSDAGGPGECVTQSTASGDVMRAVARQRLRQAKSMLGGAQADTFRVPYFVYLLDRDPTALAAELEVRDTSITDMLKLALRKLAAGVYR